MSKLYFKVASDWQEVVRLRTEVDRLEKQLRSMDANKAPQAVAVLNKQIIESKQQLRGMVDEAAKAGAVMEKDFKSKIFQGSKVVNDFTDKIIKQKGVVKDVEADVRRLANAYKSVRNNPLKASNALSELNSARRVLDEEKASLFGLQQEQSKAKLSVKKLRDEYALYKDDSRHVVDANGGMAISFGKALGAVGGAAAISGFMHQLTSVRGMFQKYEAVLANAFDGDKVKAKDTMSEIGVFAATTNFQLDELTDNFIKLVNRGVTPTMETFGKLGDFANTTAKPMAQLNEAILDINNPERWKEFGVQVSTQGDRVNLTFRGITIQAERSVDSVMKAIEQFGSMKGVAGSTAAIAGTIEGQLSNLEDTITTVFNKIGENSEGFISESISLTSDLISNYEIIGKILGGLIATYGAYRTAIIVCNLVEKIGASIKLESALAGHALTTSQGLAALATKQLTAAQLMLNKAMLANPYVLAATLVTGLIAATVILTDTTTAVSRAQQEFNDRLDTYNQYLSEENKRVGDFSSKIKDENLSREERHKAYKTLITISPVVFGKYKTEKELIDNMTKALREFNQEQENKLKLMNLHNSKKDTSNLDELKKLKELYLKKQSSGTLSVDEDKQLRELYAKYNVSKARDKGTYRTSELTAIDDLILAQYKKIGLGQSVLRKQNQIAWELTLDDMSKDTAIALRKHYEESKKTFKGYKWFSIGESAPVNEKILDDRIKQLNTKVINVEKKGANDYIEEAKKAWDEAKKEVEKVKKGSYKTASDYDSALKKAQENEKEKKELYEKRRGTTDKELSKQESVAERLRKETEQYKILLEKQELDKIRAAEDLQMQFDDANIKLMSEGSDKIITQMELNFEKEMQAIDRQKEDLLRKKIENARSAFNANPKNKNKTFDASGITLSDDENDRFDELYNNSLEQFLKNQNDFNQKSKRTWSEYLKEFGTYQEKRKAIQDLYQDKISKAETDGEKATLGKQMENELDNLDNSVKNSATLMGQLFADASQKSVTEIQSVIDKAELLMKYLEAVKDEQGNANIGGQNVSKKDILNLGVSDNTLNNLATSSEQVESLRNAINKLKGDLGNRSPFKLLETQIKNATDKISQGGKKNIAQGITEIGNAINQFAPQAGQFGKDLGNIVGSDDLGNKISGIMDTVGGLGQTAAGVGQIMSGDIVGGAMSAVAGISQVVDALDGLFGADYSQYESMKEQYDTLNGIWDELIDKKKEYIETSYGDEAYKVGREAEELQKKVIESNKILGKELLNSGASAGSHSIGVRIAKNMSREGWAEARKALGAAFQGATDGRMTGLFDLSVEQLTKLKEEAPTFWAKLNEDVRGYLDGVIEGSEKLEEIQEQVKEQLTQVSFDGVFDSFVDTLMDMDSSSEDFANNFGGYLQKAILTSMVADRYRERLRQWYTSFSDANKDGNIDKNEYSDLQKEYESIAKDAIEERNKLKEMLGWSSDGPSSDSPRSGTMQMTQDEGRELNGRFTAMQIAGEEIKAQNVIQSKHFETLVAATYEHIAISSETRNIADDLRDIQAKSYLELVEIRDNTGETVKQLKSVNERLGKIESNTNGL